MAGEFSSMVIVVAPPPEASDELELFELDELELLDELEFYELELLDELELEGASPPQLASTNAMPRLHKMRGFIGFLRVIALCLGSVFRG